MSEHTTENAEVELTGDEIDMLVYEAGPDADHDRIMFAVERIIDARLAPVQAILDAWEAWDGSRGPDGQMHPDSSSPHDRERLRTALSESRTPPEQSAALCREFCACQGATCDHQRARRFLAEHVYPPTSPTDDEGASV